MDPSRFKVKFCGLTALVMREATGAEEAKGEGDAVTVAKVVTVDAGGRLLAEETFASDPEAGSGSSPEWRLLLDVGSPEDHEELSLSERSRDEEEELGGSGRQSTVLKSWNPCVAKSCSAGGMDECTSVGGKGCTV